MCLVPNPAPATEYVLSGYLMNEFMRWSLLPRFVDEEVGSERLSDLPKAAQ